MKEVKICLAGINIGWVIFNHDHPKLRTGQDLVNFVNNENLKVINKDCLIKDLRSQLKN